MGKEALFLLFSSITQISLLLFSGTGGDVSVGVGNSTTTKVTDLILNPENIVQNPFYIFLTGSLGLFVAATAVLVYGFFLRNERVIFLGIAATFFSYIFPLFNLYQFLTLQGVGGAASGFLVALVVSPLIIIGLGVLLDFAQGKS